MQTAFCRQAISSARADACAMPGLCLGLCLDEDATPSARSQNQLIDLARAVTLRQIQIRSPAAHLSLLRTAAKDAGSRWRGQITPLLAPGAVDHSTPARRASAHGSARFSHDHSTRED